MHDPTPTSVLIGRVCEEIKEILLQKNAAYGDSALNPLRVFSKADPLEQINVRIDDKLSRLARGNSAGEDTELDLIGYLILKRVAVLRSMPQEELVWGNPAYGAADREKVMAAIQATSASLGGYIPEDP